MLRSMGDFLTFFADLLLRPRVVKSSRGEFTVHIPLLKKANAGMVPPDVYTTMAGIFPGVESFAPDYAGGHVSVKYDPGVTSEDAVLAGIQCVIKTAIANRRRLIFASADMRSSFLEKLKKHVEETGPERLALGRELELPDSMWQ